MKSLLPFVLLPFVLCAQHVPGRFYNRAIRKAIAAPRPPGADIPLSAEPFWEMGPLSPSRRQPVPRFGARQIGVRREVPSAAFAVPLSIALPDGRPALRVALHSEGAAGIRVHFQVFRPAQARFGSTPPDRRSR